MNHIIDSVTAQEFFLQCGIVISGNSTLDNVSLYDMKTGETLQLVTKSPFGVPCGVHGIYVDVSATRTFKSN